MNPLILLDFDRTLFDTDSFWQEFAKCLSEVSGIGAPEILNQYQDYAHAYRKSNNILRYVGYDDFIEKYQISHQEIINIVAKNIRGDDYLYPDAVKLLNALLGNTNMLDMAILSYGQERFQSLKISSCESLNDITSYLTQTPKAEFIRHYFSDRHGYLVDDKLGQNLENSWIEVNINRSLKLDKLIKIAKNQYQISDLSQLYKILNKKHHLTE